MKEFVNKFIKICKAFILKIYNLFNGPLIKYEIILCTYKECIKLKQIPSQNK